MDAERWRNVEDLYHTALEREPEERGKFLAEACRGDPDLLRELESLLGQDVAANGPLDRPAWDDAASLLGYACTARLEPGMEVGPYRIGAPIGAGGMGRVYKAHDSRLDRDVALKVLREDAAEHPRRRSRFEIEARAVAALNHPNIVSIFDFGEVDGYPYAVSELIEGESLRVLVQRGSVSVRKLIEIAVQVADGLAAAHAARIAHRDLKPENLMITSDSRVKILDFGLAHREVAVSEMPKSAAPAAHVHITEPGTILGTPSYMSPEQACGARVDYRSDQFSFGLILYELATRKQAFNKGSTVETLAAIVREEPAPLATKVPAPLRWIIDRCLAKAPQHRYESTHDLYEDLRSLQDHLREAYGSSELAEPRTGHARISHAWRTAALAAIVTSLLVLAIAVLLATRDTGANLSQYRYTPLASDAKYHGDPIWSPNGKAITYPGIIQGETHLFVRYIASPAATDLEVHRDGALPLGWSPDSRRVFFSARSPGSGSRNPKQSFYSMSVFGGDPAFIMDTPPPNGYVAGAFSPDGQSVAAFCRFDENNFSVFVSAPLGSPWRHYRPDPFATTRFYNGSSLNFAPDGKKAFLWYTDEKNVLEAWILPFPIGVDKPHRVLTHLPTYTVTAASWMPDSRHLVIGMSVEDNSHHLPDWSPTSDWVTFQDQTGWNLISADGKTVKRLGQISSQYLAFSKDGRQLYGIREERAHVTLFSLE